MARTPKRPPLSDEARAERRKHDRETARQAVERLQSSAGWLSWLSARSRFRSYSLGNQLLIAMQKPDATRVTGFRNWLKLGYCVRKGETAIRIWVPIPPSKRQLEQWEKAGKPPKEKPRTHFKLGPVFDRAQVEELPPPAEPAVLDPPVAVAEGDELAWTFKPLTALAAKIGCTVADEELPPGVGGCFRPKTKQIALSPAGSANARAAVLVHELGHALMRLERSESDPELSYAQEELVVESIAFTVCAGLGIDVSGFSVPYLASWAEQAGMEVIEKTAELIDRHAKRIELALDCDNDEDEQADGDERVNALQAA